MGGWGGLSSPSQNCASHDTDTKTLNELNKLPHLRLHETYVSGLSESTLDTGLTYRQTENINTDCRLSSQHFYILIM